MAPMATSLPTTALQTSRLPKDGAPSGASSAEDRREDHAMKVIILAQPNDNHTAPIKWALQQAGYNVACWAGLSWTEKQQASLLFDQETKLTLGPYEVEPGDTVWIRRPELPVPNPKSSEADKKFADHEYRNFYHSIAYMLE